MSRSGRLWTLLAAGIVLLACQKERTNQDSALVSSDNRLTFTATIDGAETRTFVDGTKISWNAAEEINIFYGASGGSRFVSTNTEPSQSVSFSGTLTAFTGTTESGEANSFWAIYPYDSSNSSGGTRVIARLPENQVGVPDNIPDKTMVMVAKAPGLALAFKQVCAMLRVIVDTPDIERIEIRGDHNETIAGRITVSMDSAGNPVWGPTTLSGGKEINLTPSGTTFEQADYYVPLLPQEFTEGFTITCYKAGGKGSYSTGAVTFIRNQVKSVRTSKVTDWDITPAVNEIWYTSTDGEVVPYTTNESTGNEVLSNTYSDGKGVIRFADVLVTVDANAFYGADRLASVTLPEEVTEISDFAFTGCRSLAEVHLGNSVQYIRQYAFANCAFSEIVLPEGLTGIGRSSFINNRALESIHFPESVGSLGAPYYYYDNPFAGCVSLRAFSGKFATDDGLSLLYGNGVNARNTLVSVAIGSGTETYRVPDGVEVIVQNAFFYAPFEAVDLNEVTQIGEWAFSCSQLQSVRIPSSVTHIDDYAFGNCWYLSDMWFESDNLPRLYSYAFGGSEGDEDTDFTIHIPGFAPITSHELIQEEGSVWSHYIYETDRISLYQTSDEIWYHRNDGISTIQPDGNFGTESDPVTAIGSGVFYISNHPRFTPALAVPDGADFEYIGMTKMSGPVTSVPDDAFNGMTFLDYLSIPTAALSVGEEAFMDCTALPEIYLPNVTSLGVSAFNNCTNLETATLGGLTGFPQNAFAGCVSLKSVILPTSGITTVGDNAFYCCNNLVRIASEPGGLGKVDLPNATFLGAEAFNGCASLSIISIPKVQVLGNHCFGNHKMRIIALPAVRVIETGALGCGSLLEAVRIGKSGASVNINLSNKLFSYDEAGVRAPEINMEMKNTTVPVISDDTFTFSTGSVIPRRVVLPDETVRLAYRNAWRRYEPFKQAPKEAVLDQWFVLEGSY